MCIVVNTLAAAAMYTRCIRDVVAELRLRLRTCRRGGAAGAGGCRLNSLRR